MRAFERFVAREDRLSAVLLSLPFHEAPAGLAARIRDAALSAEAQRQQEENACFAPPDSLEEAVLRQAEALHAAQTDCRRAILRQAAQEEDLSRLFGGQLSQEAKDWLRQAARSELQDVPAPLGASLWRQWRVKFAWRHPFALGWAFCLVLLCGLLLRVYVYDSPLSDKVAFMPVMPEAAVPPSMAEINETAALAPVPGESLSAPKSPVLPPPPAAEPAARSGTTAANARALESSPPAVRASRLTAAPVPPVGKAAISDEMVAAVAPRMDMRPQSLESKRNAPLKKQEHPAAATLPPSPESEQDAHSAVLSQNQADLVILYPANATQWRKIAAILTPPHDRQTFVWQLFAGDPKTAEVRALADYLRRALPDGHTLSLRADSRLAAIEARLERQTLGTK